ncbi:MAG TPA: homoserine dehydrogenase [Candidatus Kapabacteria bacterium]|nr:homoserine dehydrogenase [Candidatus Kapabacteria bacterium]
MTTSLNSTLTSPPAPFLYKEKGVRRLRVALFGFGVVGTGVWNVLHEQRAAFRKQFNAEIEIAGICVRDLEKPRLASAPAELITTRAAQLLEDDSIDVVIELIGGRYEAASVIERALEGRKHVITANKLVLAHELPRLSAIAERHGVELLYSASVCGSVPVLQALDELRTRDTIRKISGIVNGSTNFILTMMSDSLNAPPPFQGGGRGVVDFSDAVAEARRRGFLEADASLDLSGADAAQKLSVLAYHAFGEHVRPHEIVTEGIERITSEDIRMALTNGETIKLIASASQNSETGKVEATVRPHRVPLTHLFAHTRDEFNALEIETQHAGPQVLYGKGAGSLPTASAVTSDLVSLLREE